jgi:predicted PurR-regulated permease PerM
VGTVLAIFMLLFLLKDWNQITGWTLGHVGLSPAVSRSILAGTVSAFRGYVAGLTLIGVANAVVVAVGALLLGVPMAGTIALAMLAIALLANNTIQNVVEPFAFGARLRLHPLAVLLTVTTASLLFGFMGAILAAPLTSAAVNTYHLLRDAGTPYDAAEDGAPPSADPASAPPHPRVAPSQPRGYDLASGLEAAESTPERHAG